MLQIPEKRKRKPDRDRKRISLQDLQRKRAWNRKCRNFFLSPTPVKERERRDEATNIPYGHGIQNTALPRSSQKFLFFLPSIRFGANPSCAILQTRFTWLNLCQDPCSDTAPIRSSFRGLGPIHLRSPLSSSVINERVWRDTILLLPCLDCWGVLSHTHHNHRKRRLRPSTESRRQ